MTEKPYKYATEAGLVISLGPYQLCQQKDLQSLEKDDWMKYYNIYFICQRSRIEVQPNSLVVYGKSLGFTFNVYEKDFSFEVPGGIENPFKSKKVKMEAVYPYNYIHLADGKGNKAIYKSSHVLDESRDGLISVSGPTFLNLEVLYIGQTKQLSNKLITDRLVNHRTLQEIYSKKSPDKDIYLFLCAFNGQTIIDSKFSEATQKEFEQEDVERLRDYLTNKVTFESSEHITLTEAALIRYFEPKYNSTYKNTFPSPNHTSYAKCFERDLNAITLYIDGSLHFFSDKISPSNYHVKTYHLNTDEERRKLFSYLNEEDKSSGG